MKYKVSLLLKIALIACQLAVISAVSLSAQTIVSPQIRRQLVMNAVTAATTTPNSSTQPCAPSAGATCSIPNTGNVYHTVTYSTGGSGTLVNIQIELDASNDGTTFFRISDVATDQPSGQIFAIGNYPVLKVNLIQFQGIGGTPTLTAYYVGTSSISGNPTGLYNPSQQVRNLVFYNISAGASNTATIPVPYANAGGMVEVLETALPASSTLTISYTNELGNHVALLSTPLSSAGSATEDFYLPNVPVKQLFISYASGGASAGSLILSYLFNEPGQQGPNYATHITTATNTRLNLVPGASGTPGRLLHSIVINTGVMGATATVFDSNSASCAGPISTLAVIDASTSRALTFDLVATTGLCITTVGTADITANYQ